MPINAANFRFAGVDGRGRQQLVRDPSNGGAAVIRIEDPQGGSEGYTFDVTWGGNYNYNPGSGQRPPADNRYPPAPNPIRRFTTDQAVSVCQDSVRQRALSTYGGRNIEFRNTRLDDQPGRNDWVVGTIEILRRGNMPDERMRFSCSVNFDTGQVRSVDLQPMGGGYGQGGADRMGTQRAIDNCQQAVRARMQRDGNPRVEFPSVRMDDNPGRNDWVVGTVRAERGRGYDDYSFSCSVDLRDGDVRSVDVTRR
jgi:hypothetical protein